MIKRLEPSQEQRVMKDALWHAVYVAQTGQKLTAPELERMTPEELYKFDFMVRYLIGYLENTHGIVLTRLDF